MNLPWFVSSQERRKPRYRDHIVSSYRVLPERVFSHLASNQEMVVHNCMGRTDEWVSARFTPSDDRMLCLGGNDGTVGLYNVSYATGNRTRHLDDGLVSWLPAHSGAVMGVYGVPGKSNELLSIGGDGTAKIFDMETKLCIACFDGHDTIVRAASFEPGCSDVFATCGRDGKFCLHDKRCQTKMDRNNVRYIPVRHSVSDAHLLSDSGIEYKGFSSPPGVTNIIYLDDNTVITSSDKAISGVRFWDLRKLAKKPFRTLNVPQRRESKQIGVVSMDVNRFSSSLFIAVTDNNIYEFLLGSGIDSPVRRLKHACTSDYDLVISASPVSDHLLSGSVDKDSPKALLYDIPTSHCVENDIYDRLEEVTPTFHLEGHNSGVTAVSWSCYGNYVVTLDQTRFRIWYPNFERDSNEEIVVKSDMFPSFERAKFTKYQYKQSLTMNSFQRLLVSPRNSPFKSPVKKRMRKNKPASTIPNVKELIRSLYMPKEQIESEIVEEQPTQNKVKTRRNLLEYYTTARNTVAPSESKYASGQQTLPSETKLLPSSASSSPAINTIKRYFSPSRILR